MAAGLRLACHSTRRRSWAGSAAFSPAAGELLRDLPARWVAHHNRRVEPMTMPSAPIFRRGPRRAPPGRRACPGQVAVPPQDHRAAFQGDLPVDLRAESVQADCRRGNPLDQQPVEPPLQPHLESPPKPGPFGDHREADRFCANAQGTTWIIWGGLRGRGRFRTDSCLTPSLRCRMAVRPVTPHAPTTFRRPEFASAWRGSVIRLNA